MLLFMMMTSLNEPAASGIGGLTGSEAKQRNRSGSGDCSLFKCALSLQTWRILAGALFAPPSRHFNSSAMCPQGPLAMKFVG
jgi:hypothetical protein